MLTWQEEDGLKALLKPKKRAPPSSRPGKLHKAAVLASIRRMFHLGRSTFEALAHRAVECGRPVPWLEPQPEDPPHQARQPAAKRCKNGSPHLQDMVQVITAHLF